MKRLLKSIQKQRRHSPSHRPTHSNDRRNVGDTTTTLTTNLPHPPQQQQQQQLDPSDMDDDDIYHTNDDQYPQQQQYHHSTTPTNHSASSSSPPESIAAELERYYPPPLPTTTTTTTTNISTTSNNNNNTSTDETRDLVKQFLADIWNRGALDRIPVLCSPSLRFNGNTGFDRVGHDGLARMVLTIRGALEDYHCEIHSMVVEHNKAFCRLRFTGRHVGDLIGIAPTGRTVAWMGATEFTVQNHKILKVWELGDVKSLEEQLLSGNTTTASEDSSRWEDDLGLGQNGTTTGTGGAVRQPDQSEMTEVE